MKHNLTLRELEDAVTYSEEGGKTRVLLWKAKAVDNSGFNTRFAGIPAGCITAQGYVHMNINGSNYKLHRLVYMLHHKIPILSDVPSSIDHHNRDTTDNRISNLRDGSSKTEFNTNGRNRQQVGDSKYIGVCLSDRLRGKYGATIGVSYHEVVLCTYREELEAAEYYKAACVYLGYEVDNVYRTVNDIELPVEVLCKIEKKRNLPPLEDKTSPYDGVTWSKQKGKWVSRLHQYTNGGKTSKNLHLGYYVDDHEASIRRDLEIIENGYTNPLITIKECDYKHYRELYPVRRYKKVKVTLKIDGSFSYYNGMTRIADKLHLDKRKISAILNKSDINRYKWDFEWVYFTKKELENVIIN